MFFSILIPTYNRPDKLLSCLESINISRKDHKDIIFEVIVSDDGDLNWLNAEIREKYQSVMWIKGPENGPAANRNNAAKFASGDWLIFLDDDVVPERELLNNYFIAIKEFPAVMAFEGAIHLDSPELFKMDLAECPINLTGGSFWSANICIKKELFFKIGCFDERFVIAAQEDQDIFERIKKVTEVRFISTCVVVHPVRIAKLSNKIRNIFLSVNNWFLFEEKYHKQTPKRIIQVLLDLLIVYIKNIFNSLIKIHPKSFLYFMTFLFFGIPYYLFLAVRSNL